MALSGASRVPCLERILLAVRGGEIEELVSLIQALKLLVKEEGIGNWSFIKSKSDALQRKN